MPVKIKRESDSESTDYKDFSEDSQFFSIDDNSTEVIDDNNENINDNEEEDDEEMEQDSTQEYQDEDEMEQQDTNKETLKESQYVNMSLDEKRKMKVDQKNLAHERKLAKPQGELVHQLKKIWETLRKKEITQIERETNMQKMMQIITGNIADLIQKHDASRMIQCALKYGNSKQRDIIAEELKTHTLSLAKSNYGKFIVSKILNLCPKYRNGVITSFYGHVPKLIKHKDASIVLEEAYSSFANSQQKSNLIQEFYGSEFALFKTNNEIKTLNDILNSTPEKKPTILKHLLNTLQSILSKADIQIGSQTILHRVILDYFLLIQTSGERSNIIELVKDHLVTILHTREGARVAQLCLIFGTAKDRKHILKSFKSFIHKIAIEQYGHTVLFSCFECIDDTVLVNKTIFSELITSPKPGESVYSEGIHNFGDVLRHKYGSRVVLFLLVGRDKRYQPTYVISELELFDESRKQTSKKEDPIRSKELLEMIIPFVISSCVDSCVDLLKDKLGSQVIFETMNSSGDKTKLIEQLVKLTSKEEINQAMTKQPLKSSMNAVKKLKMEADSLKRSTSTEHVFINFNSNKVYKQLFTTLPEFALKVWDFIKQDILYWMTVSVEQDKTSGLVHCLLSLLNSQDQVKSEMSLLIKPHIESLLKKFQSKPKNDCQVGINKSKKRNHQEIESKNVKLEVKPVIETLLKTIQDL